VSGERGGSAGRLSRIFRWLFPGELGREAGEELEEEYRHRLETRGGLIATVWYAAHLLSPGSWALAFRLRRREMTRRREAGRRAEGDDRARAGSGRTAGVRRTRGGRIAASSYWADLKHSIRALLRRPGFSLLIVATLAVGIGTATAVFSLAEALVLRPLPLEDSERLVRVFSTNATRGFDRFSVSYPDFSDFASRTDLFESASFYVERTADISGEGDPERIETVAVHDGFFQTLRTPVLSGRLFDRNDHDPANPLTAVVSESFWARRFGRDPGAIGSTMRLDGVPHTVIGIVDERFAWPAGAAVWTPLQWGGMVPEYADARSNHSWQMIGRVRTEVRVHDASAQIAAMARSIYSGADVDARDEGTEAIVVPLHSSESGEGTGALFATLGAAVFLVLLMACMNASGLLLTRARIRARELSLRAALGAGRGRLVSILFGECAALAALGGGLGVVLGHFGLRRAFEIAPPSMTNEADLRLNAPVLAAGLAITLLAALLAGLLPALKASRVPLSETLKEGGAHAGQGRSATRLRRGMVVAELALSLTLLVTAGLALRGVQRQMASDPGFDASALLSFTVRLPAARYGEPALVDAFYDEAVDRLEGVPGVLAATSTSRLPLGAGGLSLGRSFIFDGAVPPPEGAEYGAAWVEVDPGYFQTLGVRATEGRVFTSEDRGDGALVAIVNERMARLMSPDEPIVGRRIRSYYDENLPRTVVGIVPDLQYNGVSRAQRTPLVIVPRSQSVRTAMAFLVRTVGDPSEIIPVVRETMTGLDPDVALDQIQPLQRAHATDLGGLRFLSTLFGAFGALALVLAISGVYAVVSYSVTQRTREFGLRLAVGADPSRLRGSVIVESGKLTGIGLAIGFALAYGAGRVLESGMNGVARLELSTYLGVGLLLGVAVLLASWLPARRATRVDPVDALKAE
jgi:putative ABC transport system permease protein